MTEQEEIILVPGTIQAIRERLMHAHAEHPEAEWKGKGKYWALGVICDEVMELVQAVEHETPERANSEALDVMATAIRFYQGEWK